MADLEAFRVALADWNTRMNLVGPSALAEFWLRHAYDSAQLLPLEPEALRWADLGAGAGFPGLVLAIMLKGRTGAQVHLVESMAKRCRFLEETVTALALPATVHHARAEDLDISVDVVAARACAPLVRLFGYARPYLRRGAIGLFMKGQDVVTELETATKSWRFEAELIDSRSHTDGRIVRMRKLKHV
ncbi:MAG TPA: 16S rRNA (guanine(527)-N(7))-methyltransferase RsmG [Caulobacteraceae bacterium]|nr:16S rRNA (guanine(527)-N(7))-methyltransferase RsmG [Caulobacteraceae bacterium]